MNVSRSGSVENVAAVWARRALLILVGLAGATSGCATENKVTRGPHFVLTHPDFWAVKSVATKDGEPTKIGIGKFSETVIDGGAGATSDSMYENSQAEVDARI